MSVPEGALSGGYHELKEHGVRDFPFNIYPCSIPVDFRQVPVHWHEEIEIISIKKGRGIVTVDREAYELEAGELILVFPGQLHGISSRRGETVEYENIIFRPSMLMTASEDLCTARFLLPLTEGHALGPLPVKRGAEAYGRFAACIERLDGLCGNREYGYQMAVKGELFGLLYLTFQVWGAEAVYRPRKSREKIKQILAYIEENYGEVITVEEAAGLCYYSKSHFMKYFRQYMGLSFVQYLNDYRLSKAAGLLVSTEDSVTDIAQRCGFDNLSYFNRLFRRKYGMTPGRYRMDF